MSDGAARFAVAAARTFGWDVEPHEVDVRKCGADCRTGHRRPGGSVGYFCPTARFRNTTELIATSPDLVLVLMRLLARQDGSRLGQRGAKDRGIAVWEYRQRGEK
jgi:hypothetical protein